LHSSSKKILTSFFFVIFCLRLFKDTKTMSSKLCQKFAPNLLAFEEYYDILDIHTNIRSTTAESYRKAAGTFEKTGKVTERLSPFLKILLKFYEDKVAKNETFDYPFENIRRELNEFREFLHNHPSVQDLRKYRQRRFKQKKQKAAAAAAAAAQAPTQAPTQAPKQASTQAPAQAPAQAPVQAPVQAPAQAPAVAKPQAGKKGRDHTFEVNDKVEILSEFADIMGMGQVLQKIPDINGRVKYKLWIQTPTQVSDLELWKKDTIHTAKPLFLRSP
jgi:hypothetical protein